MLDYNDFIEDIKSSFDSKDRGYSIPLFPTYNKVVGNILPRTFTVLGGLPSAGTTSFMDQNYVLNPLYNWFAAEEDYNLKVLYFSFKNETPRKLKTFLCNYSMLFHKLRIDINTLESGRGRRFNMDESDVALAVLDKSKDFYNAALQNEHLNLYSGRYTPESFYNQVTSLLHEMGSFDDDGNFEFTDASTTVIIAIDNADVIEADEHLKGRISKKELHRRLLEYIEELKTKYGVSIVANILIDRSRIHLTKDTIPKYNQLGEWGVFADVGSIIYAPIKEDTVKVVAPGDDASNYIINGVDYLRYWYVVKNSLGPEAEKGRFLFAGGSSFGVEHLDTVDNLVMEGTSSISDALYEDRNLY